MDAIQATIEHIKDGISGAEIIGTDNIVLDLAAAQFLLGLCKLNARLTCKVPMETYEVFEYSGIVVQDELRDYIDESEVHYPIPKNL